MAVIQFTQADKLAGKVMEKGGGTVQLTKLEQKASGSQKSVNFWATFRLTAGPYMGKELDCCFNTETSNASLLGNMKFFPHNQLLKVKAAIDGIKFDDVDVTTPMDTDTLMNRNLDITWDVVTVEGDLINVITNFLPAGKANGAVPF